MPCISLPTRRHVYDLTHEQNEADCPFLLLVVLLMHCMCVRAVGVTKSSSHHLHALHGVRGLRQEAASDVQMSMMKEGKPDGKGGK